MGLAGSGGEGAGPAGAAGGFSATGKGGDDGAALEEGSSDDGSGTGGLVIDAKGGWVNTMLSFFCAAAGWAGAVEDTGAGAMGGEEGAEGGFSATGEGGDGGAALEKGGAEGEAGTGGLVIDAKGGWVNIILSFFGAAVGAADGWAGGESGGVEDTGAGATGGDAAGLAAGAAGGEPGGVTTLRRSGCLGSSLMRPQANDFPAKRNQKDSLAVGRGMSHVSAKLSHKSS
jgi:hypothetical protein